MNMGGLERRVTKLEKKAGVGQIKPIRVCIQWYGQTKAEAMKAAQIKPDDNSMTIFLVRFARSHEGHILHEEKPKPTLSEIDVQIQQLRTQLKEDVET